MNDNFFAEFFGNPDNFKDTKPKTPRSYEEELDEAWSYYQEELEMVKSYGYKVLRNSEGKHKIVKKSS